MEVTAFTLAQRYIGIHEIGGNKDHPLILWWLSLCEAPWATHDEVPWCSAFLNGIAWELRLPRSKDLRARSWLNVGTPVLRSETEVRVGFDVAILKRAGTDGLGGGEPGPEVIEHPGHVGLVASLDYNAIWLLGGNQSNSVSLATFKPQRILGIRRLA